MSIRALLKGTEAILRGPDVLDDPDPARPGKLCGVQPLGRPPAGFGQLYVAVWWAGATGDDPNPQAADVLHGVGLTVTARTGFAPRDRRGKVVADALGLYDLVDQIAGPGVVHGNWLLVRAANRLIAGTAEYVAIHGGSATANGFCEPLVFQAAGPLVEAPGEWVGADAGEVLTCEIRFGLARRVQVLYP